MNRFKGLDLVDRVHEELWTEVHNIVQKAVTKTIPKGKKKKFKKEKWLSEEALQIKERREVKRNGERKRYTQLNAEFQRIARRDKRALTNNAKKQTKTREWENEGYLQENQRCKDGHNKEQKLQA